MCVVSRCARCALLLLFAVDVACCLDICMLSLFDVVVVCCCCWLSLLVVVVVAVIVVIIRVVVVCCCGRLL